MCRNGGGDGFGVVLFCSACWLPVMRDPLQGVYRRASSYDPREILCADGFSRLLWLCIGPLPDPQERLKAAKDTSKAPMIDVTQHGLFKVLGKGRMPAQPIVVKAKFFSKLAEKKIKENGGACQLVA